MKWIPVSERLPDEDGYYLATVKNGYKPNYDVELETEVLEYFKPEKMWIRPSTRYWVNRENVLAWMPLPDPYRG